MAGPVKYIRLSKSNFTPSDTCYQAVRILDTVAEQAIRTGDTDLMFRVAEKFVDLASRLSPGEEYDEGEAEEPAKHKLGFHV
jgi:hypothetical protein